MTRVGILFDERRDPPFNSVSKLWDTTVEALASRYETTVHPVSSFAVDCETPAFARFIAASDLLFTLSPYYSIDRARADIPLAGYALGSLPKGGHWLHHNAASFRQSDSLIVTSSSCEKILHATAGTATPVAHRMPFGIDTARYRPRDRQAMRAKHGIPAAPFVMLYSGRVSPQKNCTAALRLVAALRERGHDIHMVFVGSFDDFVVPDMTPYDDEAAFRSMVDDLDLAGQLTFVEHKHDADAHAEIIATADLGVNFTTAPGENYGYTQVEYQACGIPVLCTDYGGLRDTVEHGVTGYRIDTTLTPAGVTIDFEQAVAFADDLIRDNARRKLLAENAAARGALFSMDAFRDNLCDVIEATRRRPVSASPLAPELAPAMRRLYDALDAKYGGSRGVHTEHLHPELDPASYRHVVSRLVTHVALGGGEADARPVPVGVER